MIKSKDGAVEVKGSTTVLMTDLSMIIKLLRETFEEEDIPKETGDKLIRKAVDVGFWTEDKLDKELSNMRAEVLGKLMGLALSSSGEGQRMNKNTYEAETLEEEFALLAGRLTALEAVLNANDSTFIDKKYVAAIMGIKYFEGDSDKKEE